MSYVQRVGDQAQQIRLTRVLLSLVAAPFYAVGWLVGILAVAVLWMFAAVAVGFGDAKNRSRRRS